MLRMNHLPEKESFSVIDAFAGEGLIWDYIKKETGKEIEVLKIDKRNDLEGIYLKGDNLKFIQCLPLEEFDVIDLDAYGVCFDLIDWIVTHDRQKGVRHKIFVTFIQSMFGQLPIKMLERLGYSRRMIDKIPTLFNRAGLSKFKSYLVTQSVERIFLKTSGQKHYLFFET